MSEPVVAQKSPYEVELKGTYRYAWCACGLSDHQPFCDGSHTSAPGITPVVFTAEKSEAAASIRRRSPIATGPTVSFPDVRPGRRRHVESGLHLPM